MLGRGAVADVFDGHDVVTGRPVAVKVLRSSDEEALRRFDREIAVLETIDHPRIVRLVASGGDDRGCRYIVLEHVGGGTLGQRLTTGPLPTAQVRQLAVDLAGALAHAHAHGLVHRDLKPANVLLDGSGHAKLADFGIARLTDAEALTATGSGIGTPAYMAPEQLRGGDIGPAADVYSLGLVLIEATTGQRPFPGRGLPGALARLDRAPVLPADLAPPVASVLRSMTAIDPGDRPAAASIPIALGMVEAAEGDATTRIDVAGTPTTLVPIAAAGDPDHRHRPRWPLAAVAASLLLLALAWGLARDAGAPGDETSPTTTVAVADGATTTPSPATVATTVTVAPTVPAAPARGPAGGGPAGPQGGGPPRRGGGPGHGHGHGPKG